VGRKPFYSAEDKIQVVLSVLRGEMTQTDAGRKLQLSQTTIAKWYKQFLAGGHEALARVRTRIRRRTSGRPSSPRRLRS
jgi:transposase